HLATTTGAHDRHGARRRSAEEAGVGAAAERVDGRVLEEEERVRRARQPLGDERLLPPRRRLVLDEAGTRHLERPLHRLHMLIARPTAARTASRTPSASVGCACDVAITSSAVASSLRARPASATSSVTAGPIRCTPSTAP